MYYSKISYEHREILLKERPKKLYQLSPKGTIPVLNLPDGKVIDESLDIMKWSVSVNDPDSWYVNNIDHQLEIISINDKEFKSGLIGISTMIGIQNILLNIIEENVKKY